MIRICMLLLFLAGGCLFAQNVERRQSIDSVAAWYLWIAGDQSMLYYGNAQEGLPPTLNHPYLIDAQFEKARLSYNRIIYPEVLLLLDLYRDELVIGSPLRRSIVLFPEKVDFAELYDKHIIYFRHDSLPGCPSTGYYFLLHSGECKVLEKQVAALMLDRNGNFKYDFMTRYYLYNDGVYRPINNKRGLLKVLSPYKKELKQFILSHRLRFRDDIERFIPLVVSEYENLSGL